MSPRHTLLLASLMGIALLLAGCAAPDEANAPTQQDTGGDTTPPTGGTPPTGATPTTATPTVTPATVTPTVTTPAQQSGADCAGERDCLVFAPDGAEWNVERTECAAEYSCAPEGKELVILTLVVRNEGERDISLNPFNWKLYTPTTAFSVDSSTFSLADRMDGDLRAGAETSGQLAFAVDVGETLEKICHTGTFDERFNEQTFCHDLAGA